MINCVKINSFCNDDPIIYYLSAGAQVSRKRHVKDSPIPFIFEDGYRKNQLSTAASLFLCPGPLSSHEIGSGNKP